MQLYKITSQDISKFFISDNRLCQIGLPDDELEYIDKYNEYPIKKDSEFLGVYSDDTLIALIRLELFTPLSVLCHIYLSTKYQGKKLLKEIIDTLVIHLQENTDFIKIMVPVPEPCVHVQRPAEAYGFKKEGHMKDIINWRGELVDLLWYGLDIRGRE